MNTKTVLALIMALFMLAFTASAALPSASTPVMAPAVAYKTTPLNCTATYNSPDLNTGSLEFSWFKNNAHQSLDFSRGSLASGDSATSANVPSTFLIKNDNWICSVRACDTLNCSAWINSSVKQVRNTVPRIVLQQSFVNKTAGHMFDVSAVAQDDDGATDISDATITFNVGNCVRTSLQTSSSAPNSKIGRFTCTGTALTQATTSVTFLDTDGASATTVSDSNTFPNLAPSVASASTAAAYRNESFSFTVTGSDPDGDALSYSASGVPSGAVFNPANQVLSWTAPSIGTYTITFTVTDGLASASQQFILSVKELNRLTIEKIDVTVDDKTDKDSSGTVSEDSVPLSKITLKIKVSNDFTNSQDVDINDVTVNLQVDDFDVDEDSDSFDLLADRTKTVSFSFTVPVDVDVTTTDMVITVTGKDDNRISHSDVRHLTLNVEKKSHDLRVYEADLTQDTVSCSRNSMLDVQLINFGDNDEDNVLFVIEAPQLGLNVRTRALEFTTDLQADDSKYSNTYTLNIPSTLAPGSYNIPVSIIYGDNYQYSDMKTATLTVTACATEQPTTPTTPTQPTTPVQPTTPTQPQNVTVIVQQPVQPTEQPFTESTTYVLLLAGGIVLLLLITLVLFAKLARRD